jgi:hypothetical protein
VTVSSSVLVQCLVKVFSLRAMFCFEIDDVVLCHHLQAGLTVCSHLVKVLVRSRLLTCRSSVSRPTKPENMVCPCINPILLFLG